jgi:NAD(P)-dependent dehydrogenase (short-subunit alcohol dehydrogenase family)
VEGLSQAVAQEVAPGVAVVAVNPGVVATEMLRTCFESDVSGYTSPAACAASFVRMLQRLDASWNGRSVDVADF